jgi:hypothetical protein
MARLEVDSPVVPIMLILCVLGIGFAVMHAPAIASFMDALPEEKAGIGSGVSNASRQVGGALGVGIFGTILAQQFASNLKDELRSAVPDRLLVKVSDSIGTAIGVAEEQNRETADPILGAAQASFLAGFRLALFVGAGILVVGALVVLVWLPETAVRHHDPSVDPGLLTSAVGDFSFDDVREAEDAGST